uniref:ABC transporter domain-containing protein n=1 Tax=Salix viminalis TaxID=40686 RepID=A0A6N2LC84_SALVM
MLLFSLSGLSCLTMVAGWSCTWSREGGCCYGGWPVRPESQKTKVDIQFGIEGVIFALLFIFLMLYWLFLIIRSFGAGLSNMKYFADACSAGERIMEVIRRVPKIDLDNMEGEILDNFRGEVEFRQVKFAYPSRPESIIFEDFCLQIPAGKSVALVGGSGSGKSTAIALLQRFYDPFGGEILLDGIPIDKLQLKWLRSQIGLVSQEPALFATTIMENVLFGKKLRHDGVKLPKLLMLIISFPSSLKGILLRGVQLSGGQKQRIAIARAVIKSPRILLLDEATSALDTESERNVQGALDRAAVGRTTIIISHRLSTIRNVDVIAVVQDGQVMEIGSHDELIENEFGMYASCLSTRTITSNVTTAPVSSSAIPIMKANNRAGSGTGGRRLSPVQISRSANSVAPSQVSISTEENAAMEEQRFSAPSFRRLLALNLPEWKQASFGCFGAILFGAVQPVYAFVLGSMISVFFLKDHDEIKEKIRIYSFFFLGLTFFSLIINVIQHYNFAYMGEHLTKRIRERMLSKILTFEVGWFDQDENSSGSICSRLTKDANVVRSVVGDRMALVVQTMSAVTIAWTMGLVIAWRLAIVMIAVQPVMIACYYTRSVLLKNTSGKAIKAQDESSKLAADAVSNLRTIASFSSQERILKMLEKVQEGPRRENIRQSLLAGVGLSASRSLMSCTLALDYWYGGKLIGQGCLTYKAMFETFLILVSTGHVIADAGSMTMDLSRGSDSIRSVFALLGRSTKIEPEDPDGFRPEKITGHVELENVDFSYPARPNVMIFKDFSINIEAGKSTALWIGKSTIIDDRKIYDPLKGTVKIDGRDIRSYSLRSLRKCIALVSQEPTLFSGTIKENIIYGASSDEINESEIIEAAKAANAHDFISGLKDGYDTWCGDRGVQVSGGQKQRIAIARAILKNPAILLSDEATSALDSRSEKAVQEAIEHVMVGRTSVVVAHRLSTIQSCDLIAVWIKEGGEGSHSSLLANGTTGAYYSMVSLQSRPHSTSASHHNLD